MQLADSVNRRSQAELRNASSSLLMRGRATRTLGQLITQSMASLRRRPRTWIRLGMVAAIAAIVYAPWRYGVAGNPRRGADVVECVTLRSYAVVWSPPPVPPPWMTQSMSCAPPTVDLLRLGLTLAGIAAVTGLMLAQGRRTGVSRP